MPRTKRTSETEVSKEPPEKAEGNAASKSNKEKSKKVLSPFPDKFYCSFCRNLDDGKRLLIAGPNNIFICDKCVEVASAILLQEECANLETNWRERMIDLLAHPDKFSVKPPKAKHKKETSK